MIGPLTLPPDYESDAESVMTDASGRDGAGFLTSEAESDFDMEKSPEPKDKDSDNFKFNKSPESPVENTKMVSVYFDIVFILNTSFVFSPETRTKHRLAFFLFFCYIILFLQDTIDKKQKTTTEVRKQSPII